MRLAGVLVKWRMLVSPLQHSAAAADVASAFWIASSVPALALIVGSSCTCVKHAEGAVRVGGLARKLRVGGWCRRRRRALSQTSCIPLPGSKRPTVPNREGVRNRCARDENTRAFARCKGRVIRCGIACRDRCSVAASCDACYVP